jgi:hypothetical protein
MLMHTILGDFQAEQDEGITVGDFSCMQEENIFKKVCKNSNALLLEIVCAFSNNSLPKNVFYTYTFNA